MKTTDFGRPEPKTEISEEERMVRFAAKMIAAVIMFIVATIGSCTMHSNMYDEARMKQETEQRKLSLEQSKLELASSQQKTEAIQKLIEDGHNPVAVRCAIEEWKDSDACENIGLVIGGKLPE